MKPVPNLTAIVILYGAPKSDKNDKGSGEYPIDFRLTIRLDNKMNYLRLKIPVFKILIPLTLLVCACNRKPANLIFNGSAEIPRCDSVPKGWQNIEGRWVSAEGDSAHHDYAHAKDSSHYFFGGYGLVCVLQQDADVSEYAKRIDNKKQKFVLSGFEQTLDQGQLSDQGMLKAVCLDALKKNILSIDSTDTVMSKTKWKQIADIFSAPATTRFIRVQLIAFRNVGNDNDGYFDNISLVAVPTQNYLLTALIIGAILLIAASIMYFSKKKSVFRNKIGNQSTKK